MTGKCLPLAIRPTLLKITGVTATETLLDEMTAYLATQHRDITLFTELAGDETAFSYLMNRRSTLALMDREISPVETVPYKKLRGTEPFSIKIAACCHTGSAADNASLAVYVHQDNPLGALSTAQLRRIFTQGDNAGDYSDWAQLGGGRAQIQAYTLPEHSPQTDYLLQHHFAGQELSRQSVFVANAEALLNSVQNNRYAIGIAGAGHRKPGIKQLNLIDEVQTKERQVTPSDERNPLTRFLYLYIATDPTTPTDANIRTLAELLLSAQGQKIIADQPHYGRLTLAEIKQQKDKLEALV